jgi:enolase
MKIRRIGALELLDSRGYPTVGARIHLENGTTASALVPSGASTGENEAVELRDGDPSRYCGKGVKQAVQNIRTEITEALKGMDVSDQEAIDQRLIELDGTPNKSRLGSNAILAVSMAAARATAYITNRPLYQTLGDPDACLLPVPCLNVINGGRHADNTVDFQEFKIAPHNAPSFAEAIRMGIETFHALLDLLRAKGMVTGVGDEGGFAPDLAINRDAIELIIQAIENAGYRPGEDIALCLDPASSEMWENGKYVFFKSNRRTKTTNEMIDLWRSWIDDYPIVLIEDPLAENDWEGWARLTKTLGDRIELVGDDIFCTNREILQKAIEQGVGNSILIKLNQIGTVTETLKCVRLAQRHDYGVYVSHRSGETEDTFIADLAVATGCGHIKAGSGCRGERIAKFNRLLRIEDQLGDQARFAGLAGFKKTSATSKY